MDALPDILVLGGGGRHGDAWMTGVLAGLEDAHGYAFASCDYFVGTSAGAVVAARLSAGVELERPAEPLDAASGGESPVPTWAVNSAMAIAAPAALLGLRLGTRPRELLRAGAFRIAPIAAGDALNFHAEFPSRRTRWDGRLRIVAVDRASGKRVAFGAPGAPRATVAQALAASCAIPLVFAPAVIGGRQYVDGAAWSPTNADVSPVGRGAHVLVLNPTGSYFGPFLRPLRIASRAAMLVEASALTARGAHVRTITPDGSSAEAIGRDLMSSANLEATLAAGYRQGLALAVTT